MKKLYKETTMAITDVTVPFDTDYNIIQLEVVGNLMFYEYIKKPYDSLTPIETLHVDRKPGKLTKEELVQYLYDNYYDAADNTINLSNLNFSKMNCNVNIGDMEVNGNLYQNKQTVEGNLYQGKQTVKGNLWQGNQTVHGETFQDNEEVIE